MFELGVEQGRFLMFDISFFFLLQLNRRKMKMTRKISGCTCLLSVRLVKMYHIFIHISYFGYAILIANQQKTSKKSTKRKSSSSN